MTVVRVGGRDSCDHPEDERGPAPYQGRPPSPDDWECGECGAVFLTTASWRPEPGQQLRGQLILQEGSWPPKNPDKTLLGKTLHDSVVKLSQDVMITKEAFEDFYTNVPRAQSVEFTVDFAADPDLTALLVMRNSKRGQDVRLVGNVRENALGGAHKMLLVAHLTQLSRREWECSPDVLANLARETAPVVYHKQTYQAQLFGVDLSRDLTLPPRTLVLTGRR